MACTEIQLWDGAEILSEETLYVVSATDFPLFKEVCDSKSNSWIVFSDALPGGAVSAIVFAWALYELPIRSMPSEAAGCILWIRQFLTAANELNSTAADKLMASPMRTRIGSCMGLQHVGALAEIITKSVHCVDAVWNEYLLTKWRPLNARDNFQWEPGSELRERVDELMERLELLKSMGASVQSVMTETRQILETCKMWRHLELDEKYFFASRYMWYEAIRVQERGENALAIVYAHRSLDWLFLGYCISESLVVFDAQARRFVYDDRRREETNVVRGARKVFDAGSHMIDVVKDLNRSRNSCILAHGVDRPGAEESDKAVRFVERCLREFGVLKIRKGAHVDKFPLSLSLKSRILFEAEDDYDVYFDIVVAS